METDIGNPIDYNPTVEPLPNENEKDEDDTREYYFQPSEMNYAQPPPNQQILPEKTDILGSIDKSTWIIAFAVFLLGFFMGKTMQPVILRYT
jgi:hypothetical protein